MKPSTMQTIIAARKPPMSLFLDLDMTHGVLLHR